MATSLLCRLASAFTRALAVGVLPSGVMMVMMMGQKMSELVILYCQKGEICASACLLYCVCNSSVQVS